MKKLKRALAMMLSLVMIAGLLSVPAFASESDHSARIYLTDTKLNEESGLKVEMQAKTGTTAIKGFAACVAFDSNLFSLVKTDGSTIALSGTKQTFNKDSGAYIPNSSFTIVNQMSAILDGTTGIVGIQNINMSPDQTYADYTSCGTFFLAYKEGKSKADVTASSIRWAVYAEAQKVTFSNCIAISESSAVYSVGNSDSTKDSTALKNASTVTPSNFDFAKLAYPGTIDAPKAKTNAGGKVELNAVTPTGGSGGETVQYGYRRHGHCGIRL